MRERVRRTETPTGDKKTAAPLPGRPHWLSDISELDVDDTFSLIQEILVSDQLNKEWEWTLSDKSTGYDEATKKSKFIELPRPDWMKPIPEPPKKVKMPRFMMPQGNVVRVGADGKVENVTY